MAATASEDDMAKLFKFSVLCDYMDRIRKVPKNVGSSAYFKQRAIRAVLAKWTALAPEGARRSFFPLLRLLANYYDTRKYNMKTRKLIMKVCKALLFPDASKKALMALANKSSSQALEQLAKEVATRNASVNKELTVYDVNQSLDRVTENDLSEGELHSLLKGCPSEREVFWILQVIVRKVESTMGISPSVIINSVHPHASTLRQGGTSLEKICQLAAENKLRDDSCILFKPFEPMLLARVKHGTNVYDKLVQYCGQPFYMQVKFDGEHFLIHKSGGEYRYFSRNMIDHTAKLSKSLNPRIDPCFAPSVENCILDGELLLWDVFENKHVGKGKEASDGRIYDVKNLREDGGVIACIAVFDLLYLNGRSLVDVPLNERLGLLQDGSVFQREDKSAIFLGVFETVHTRQEFAKFFEAAMLEHEEGVVVKKIDSLYKIAARYMANGCFKVKPFHLGDESLDVAIVGVKRAGDGHIESYTVAVLREGKYWICGQVGAGLDYSTREHLRQQLVKDHGFLKADTVPEWVHDDHFESDRPDDYVPKENLQVLELRAKGIANNRLYSPVIRFYRDDKFVKDIDTYETFLEFDEALRAQSIAAAESAVHTEKKRTAVVPKVMDDYRVVKKANIEQVGTDLKELNFCVLRGGPDVTAQKLREIIESFGGICSANPTRKTQFVITGEPQHMKTKSVIKGNKYNVISADWVLDSEKATVVLPIKESYILNAVDESLMSTFGKADEDEETEKVEEKQRENEEEGPAIREEEEKGPEEHTSEEEAGPSKKQTRKRGRKLTKGQKRSESIEWSEEWVRSQLKAVPDDTSVGQDKLDALKKELFEKDKFHHFMGQSFCMDESLDSLTQKYAQLLLKIHGATITSSAKDASVIVVDKGKVDGVQKKRGSKVRVVDVSWIESEVK